MNKRDSSAGTTDEQRTTADFIPSASLVQSGLLPAVYLCQNPKPKIKEAKIIDYGYIAKLDIKYDYKLTGIATTKCTTHKTFKEAKRWYGRQVQQTKYFDKPVWFLNGR